VRNLRLTWLFTLLAVLVGSGEPSAGTAEEDLWQQVYSARAQLYKEHLGTLVVAEPGPAGGQVDGSGEAVTCANLQRQASVLIVEETAAYAWVDVGALHLPAFGCGAQRGL